MTRTHETIEYIRSELGEISIKSESISVANDETRVSFNYNGDKISFTDSYNGYSQGFAISSKGGSTRRYEDVYTMVDSLKKN